MVLHSHAENIHRYLPLFVYLGSHGWIVHGYDQRGMGRTGRGRDGDAFRLGDAGGWRRTSDDVTDALDRAHSLYLWGDRSGLTYKRYLYGHGVGAVLALWHASHHGSRDHISGVISSGM